MSGDGTTFTAMKTVKVCQIGGTVSGPGVAVPAPASFWPRPNGHHDEDLLREQLIKLTGLSAVLARQRGK
jgi:hypothetical protein